MLTSSNHGNVRFSGVFACTALACLPLLIGCTAADGRVEVNGVVVCDGQPLAGASIVFVGGGGGTFGTGSTDDVGRFSIRAAPGVNKISVSAMDTSGAEEWAEIPEEDTNMGDAAAQAEAMKNMPKPLVAQRFFNSETSGLEVTVEKGMDEVTLEVTAKD